MKKETPCRTFGTLLVKLRKQHGIAQQSDFAKMVKSTQQTVSRWELGLSRPRHKQILVLANALRVKPEELLTAAGYITPKMAVATFDQPFPIDALNPDSFERFCLYFLSRKYPPADVHRIGGQGHTQGGVDIDVIFPNKVCYSFQCKRVKEFGPDKVHKAVADHNRKSKKKFILLSRVASPKSYQAIRKHKGWEIWDKEKISFHIRQLPKDDQKKLVDTFFRGQRLALLGETEPGPWLTPEEFFAPFMAVRGAFSHAWNLVGRIEETHSIVESLSNTETQAVLLIGTGGSGKSRVLKHAIETYNSTHKGVTTRFLSPTEEVTNKSLEDLGDQEKVIVVDDAHDRDDLGILYQYASAPHNKTKLLLSFRPYSLDRIKGQASNFALMGDRISEIRLDTLTLDQATELATQVLKQFGGPESVAKEIARLTIDCPLFTVIGAQVVAKEKTHFEFAKNKEAFRLTLLGKFRDIIAGDIGSTGDSDSIKKLLNILALLQPFHPEDESIVSIVEKVEGLYTFEVNRLIRLLTVAGVLFKRGGKYRLSPDLLADYIIEDKCIGQNRKSTGYAETVFDAANNKHIEHILLNLGKLDWRLANGDPSNSQLLDGIWRKLNPSSEYSDPHIRAVTAVAFYQPARALNFAQQLISESRYLRDLPNLIKYAAYNFEHLLQACEYLWELGKNDKRALHQTPSHAIRILSELCEVEQNKPIEYIERVVDFGLSLLNQENSWICAYSPFDVLKGILQTEGNTTESNGRSITLRRFNVNFRFVSDIRRKVIDATIKLISHKKTEIAVKAARFLNESMRYPFKGGSREEWTDEFVQTLEKIEEAIDAEALDHLVLIEIAHSVSWHANYAGGKTAPIAKRILKSLPDSLDFRTKLAFVDGYGRILERRDFQQSDQEWNKYLDGLTNDLLLAFPDGEQLRAFLEKSLLHLQVANKSASYPLYRKLIQSSLPLAQATVQNALNNHDSRTVLFADIALSKLLMEDHNNALTIANRFLEIDSLNATVGSAYSRLGTDIKDTEADLAILRKVLSSKDQWVIINSVGAIRNLAKKDYQLAIDLLKCIDVGISNVVADDVLCFFQRDEDIPYQLLTEEDINHFLKKLMSLPELDGYWIETFLSKVSKYHAKLAAAFFMARVERASDTKDWGYRPCNHGPYSNVPLLFRESPEFGALLRAVSQWMKSHEGDDLFKHRAGELFYVMFCPYDTELISFFLDWIEIATPVDIHIISQILSEVPPDFVFQHREFVMHFLDKAKQYSKEYLGDALSALYRATISGIRKGIPGEPFTEDVQMRVEAEKALMEIPRFSPAYRLYENLKKNADHNIDLSFRDREAFDD
ncbi:MAG: helix-turn-helix transcriptional regulator [Syntrophales bacterium]|jgi:transcriptional regulator with XRE-family HTH domain